MSGNDVRGDDSRPPTSEEQRWLQDAYLAALLDLKASLPPGRARLALARTMVCGPLWGVHPKGAVSREWDMLVVGLPFPSKDAIFAAGLAPCSCLGFPPEVYGQPVYLQVWQLRAAYRGTPLRFEGRWHPGMAKLEPALLGALDARYRGDVDQAQSEMLTLLNHVGGRGQVPPDAGMSEDEYFLKEVQHRLEVLHAAGAKITRDAVLAGLSWKKSAFSYRMQRVGLRMVDLKAWVPGTPLRRGFRGAPDQTGHRLADTGEENGDA